MKDPGNGPLLLLSRGLQGPASESCSVPSMALVTIDFGSIFVCARARVHVLPISPAECKLQQGGCLCQFSWLLYSGVWKSAQRREGA